MTKERQNLIKINDWCKENAVDETLYINNAVWCNERYYKISVSKNGIGAYGNGKFSQWLHVDESNDSLDKMKVGKEVIYNWKEIKNRILNAIEDYKRKQKIMENFEV